MGRSCQAAVSFFLLSLPALAQDARIAGRVIGVEQAPAAGAIVTAVQPDSGWKRSVLTNRLGYFSLSQLPAGGYRLEVVKPGFEPYTRKAVSLHPGELLELDLHLAADPAPETIAYRANCKSGDAAEASERAGCKAVAQLDVVAFPPFWP